MTRPEEQGAESSASDPLPPAQASRRVIPFLIGWGPLLFGVGFLAPLIAQTLDALALEVPIAPSNLAFGLGVGALAGLVARARGSWI